MKVITWNCNGALRKKTAYLDKLEADILVIQECEDPNQSTNLYKEWSGDYIWEGENKNKGIGIFVRNKNALEKLNWQGKFTLTGIDNNSNSLSWESNKLKSFLPCKINHNITLVGAWTKQANSPNFGYIGQLWKYLQIHKNKLIGENIILCGDLNSNSIWDTSDRWWNHSDVIKELEDIGIYSLYHYIKKEKQGKETKKTFFMHRKIEKSYHIDYFFVSKNLLNKCTLSIEDVETCLEYSDHVPLVLNIEK